MTIYKKISVVKKGKYKQNEFTNAQVEQTMTIQTVAFLLMEKTCLESPFENGHGFFISLLIQQ